MIKRIIYSLYIDIPESELEDAPPHWNNTVPKNEYAKLQFKEYYLWLKTRQEEYAKQCGVDYILYQYDEQYKDYKKFLNENYPQITSYNIINFYKISLLNDLVKEYDEVVYLDFDVVPLSDKNVFDHHDFNKGIHIMMGTADSQEKANALREVAYSNRSPTAKYWNARAMCMYEDLPGDHEVFNTGIILANKDNVEKLAYYENFDEVISLMDEIREDTSFSDNMRKMFGYDNETIWAYKTIKNNVHCINLEKKWHHFMDKWNYIPRDTNLVHVINKDFGYVKRWIDEKTGV